MTCKGILYGNLLVLVLKGVFFALFFGWPFSSSSQTDKNRRILKRVSGKIWGLAITAGLQQLHSVSAHHCDMAVTFSASKYDFHGLF